MEQIAPKSIYYDSVEQVPGDGQLARLSALVARDGALFAPASHPDGMCRRSCLLERLVALVFVLMAGLTHVYAFAGQKGYGGPAAGNLKLLAGCVLGGCCLAVATTWLAMRATRMIVYASALLMPMGLIMGGGYAVRVYFTSFSSLYLLGIGGAMVLLGVVLVGKMARARQRERVESVVFVIQAACQSLSDAYGIYGISGLLAFVSVAYSMLWMQIVTKSNWPLIFMFFWIQGVLESVHRFVIGRVTAVKYFQEKRNASSIKELVHSVSDTKIFGQICIVGLMRFWCGIIKTGTLGFKIAVNNIPFGVVRTAMLSGIGVVNYVEMWSCKLSDHALYYSAIYPDSSILHSAKNIVRIFRRNLVTSLLTDTSSTLLMLIMSNMSIALISCCISLIRSDPVSASMCLFMSYYSVGFFSGILTSAIDASLVCYALDLDQNKLHSPKAHQAFSSRLSILRQDNIN